MPTINTEQLIDRLQRRIAELEEGSEIANKDIRALLTDAQKKELNDSLAEQVELKKEKRARTEEEKRALGWKTIREVRLSVLKKALAEANDGILDDYKRRMRSAEVRQAKIYMEAWIKAMSEGKSSEAAKTWANNELTRAGLNRMDGKTVGLKSSRDKEVYEMEEALLEQFKSKMTQEELEQLKLLEDSNNVKKKGRSG